MVFLAGGSAMWVMASIKIGTLAFLLPVYFTVCHRMVPFFSANVIGPGYRLVRPAWTLPVMWALLLAHLLLELMHQYTWLWLVDIPLTLFFLAHWFMWQPWKCMRPGLLAVLHIALAWLPIAFALYALQSIIFALGGGFVLGRAPVHALAIGFFGSMLVAMVTRVTQGHSGRPLQMGTTAWFAFALLQLVAVLRIAAEAGGNSQGWLAAGAVLWLVAFTPWVLRGLWIYITPRADGRPG